MKEEVGGVLNQLRRNFILIVFILFLIACISGNSSAANIWNWQSYETDHFEVFFQEGYQSQAIETLYYLEKHRSEIAGLTGNELDYKISLTLEDIGLFTNGYANPVFNKMGIFTNNPASIAGRATYENWLRRLGIHELTHMAHLQNVSGGSKVTTRIFGDIMSPNIHSPLWLIEGLAIYIESQQSPAEGRLNGGYYRWFANRAAAEESLPELEEIIYNHNYFPGGQQYLYGAVFIDYLANQYGEAKFSELFNTYGAYYWAAITGNFFPGIGLDRAAKEVYGKAFSELYQDFKEFLIEDNWDFEFSGQEILSNENGYLSGMTSKDESLYYFKSNSYSSAPFEYHRINRLIEFDLIKGQEKVLLETVAGIHGGIEVQNGYAYFLLGDSKSGYPNIYNNTRGIVTNLYRLNLETGVKEKLIRDEIRDFAVLNDSIYFATARKDNYGSYVYQYKDRKVEKVGYISELIGELKAYQDMLITVSKGNQSAWNINLLDPENLELNPIVATKMPEKQISIAGDIIYYVANYFDYEAIYSYDLKSGKSYQLTDDIYARNPVIANDQLYHLSFNLDGMAIYRQDINEVNYDQARPVENLTVGSEINYDLAEVGQELRVNNGFTSNIGYLLNPEVRLLPVFIYSEDGTGLNSYQLSLNQAGSFDFNITSRLLAPLTISYNNFGQESGRYNQLRFNYPLYRSNLNGLSVIDLFYQTDFNYHRFGSGIGFRYPGHRLSLNLQANFSGQEYFGRIRYQKLFSKGRLTIDTSLSQELKPGYSAREFEVSGNSGYKIGADLTYKLIEIHQGSWNPNIFFGDLFIKPFIDYQSYDYNLLSGGFELLLETGTANWLHLVPRLGLAASSEEVKTYFGLELKF